MKDIIRIMVVVIPMFLTAFILRYFLNKNRAAKKETESEGFSREGGYIIRMPAIFRVVPCLLVIFVIAISLYILLVQLEDWPYIIIALVFVGIPGIAMFTCYSLWKIEVRKEAFVYRNFVGKVKIYQYADLELRYDDKGIKWWFYKNGKKVFCMAYYVEDGNKLERVYKKYRTKNRNGREEEKDKINKSA